jgi:hypothetical protein
MKRLVFTVHAQERLGGRKVGEDLVVSAISRPDFVVVRGDESEAYKRVAEKLLKVVYVEKESFIRIITLYWVNGDEAKDKV